MFYYKLNNHVLISNNRESNLKCISEQEAQNSSLVYMLCNMDPKQSRRKFCISDPSLAFLQKEDMNLLKKEDSTYTLPDWLLEKIKNRKIIGINTAYPNWQKVLDHVHPQSFKVHVVGIGDVGGTLLTGLRLLGHQTISSIGIYDTNVNHLKRWEFEINQILSDTLYDAPEVFILDEDDLFDCDMFVFCISIGVPSVGNENQDVRLAQYEGNKKIMSLYAKKAREKDFDGIFAVVSDPVDLLCKVAFLESNQNENGDYDGLGLSADQIRGYGLGVMNGRAAYYAKKNPSTSNYLSEGRAYGPHGEGLIIANSIEHYDDHFSSLLTHQARTANLAVRSTGFKPYIAPALSSGALSLLNTLRGQWHYSATFMGGVFMGAKNRLTCAGVELERLDLPKPLYDRIENTYKNLGSIL